MKDQDCGNLLPETAVPLRVLYVGAYRKLDNGDGVEDYDMDDCDGVEMEYYDCGGRLGYEPSHRDVGDEDADGDSVHGIANDHEFCSSIEHVRSSYAAPAILKIRHKCMNGSLCLMHVYISTSS